MEKVGKAVDRTGEKTGDKIKEITKVPDPRGQDRRSYRHGKGSPALVRIVQRDRENRQPENRPASGGETHRRIPGRLPRQADGAVLAGFSTPPVPHLMPTLNRIEGPTPRNAGSIPMIGPAEGKSERRFDHPINNTRIIAMETADTMTEPPVVGRLRDHVHIDAAK